MCLSLTLILGCRCLALTIVLVIIHTWVQNFYFFLSVMYVILFISPRLKPIPDLINYTDKPSSRLQLPAVQQSLFKLQWREEAELVGTRPLHTHTQTQSDVRRLLIRTAPFSTSEGLLSVLSLKPAHTCSPPPLSSSSFTHMHSLSYSCTPLPCFAHFKPKSLFICSVFLSPTHAPSSSPILFSFSLLPLSLSLSLSLIHTPLLPVLVQSRARARNHSFIFFQRLLSFSVFFGLHGRRGRVFWGFFLFGCFHPHWVCLPFERGGEQVTQRARLEEKRGSPSIRQA